MKNLKLDDFTNFKFISSVNISPDAKNCAFVVTRIDIEENKYLSNIYIADENYKIKKLTSFNEERKFLWKDKKTIIFTSLREKKDKEKAENGYPITSFYEINIEGGEANKIFSIPLNVYSTEIIDENHYLFTALYDQDLGEYFNLTEEEMDKKIKEKKENSDYEILDEIPFWSNGEGFTNKKRARLYYYIKNENKLIPITDEFTNVHQVHLSKEKDKALFITSSFIDKMNLYSDIYILDLNTLGIEKISPYSEFNYAFACFIKDKIVFFGSDMKKHGINQNPDIFLMEDNGINCKLLLHLDEGIGNSVGSDCRYGSSRYFKVDGDLLYFISTSGYNSFINKLDLDGKLEKITEPNGSIDDFDVVENKVFFSGLRDINLQELYVLDSCEKTVTDFNSWVCEERLLSKPIYINVKNDDVSLDGFVIKPIGFDDTKSYPAILDIHGGPKTCYGSVYYHEMQVWANQGYFVFFLNPRGSDGYGDDFADIRGKYGSIDFDDIMTFTDKILELYPNIDRERIGVTGGSYGGYMTNWIIGHTNRFKVAASQRSISNWISFFGTSDIGYYFVQDQVGTNPWNRHEKLWDNSPLKYANNVVTPTLFIHSDEDYRCWIDQGYQMFTSLKYHGVESKIVIFKGENHELSRSGKPKHRIKRLEEITNWFNKYLK
ncbi:MAG: S9 family peptidase [Tissierellales bacterium]|nr:S9 family peptidase [Tissierellales bacterium]